MKTSKFFRDHPWAAEGMLVLVTFFWGTTFTLVKDAIAQVDLFAFLGQRFTFSFFLLLPFCVRNRQGFSPDVVWKGAVLGLLLFGGYAFQTIGLLYTTASNTAFVTGLNVIFVPLLGALFYAKGLHLRLGISVLLAAAGLFFLCTGGDWSLNHGDLIVILCAVSIAFQIIYTARFVHDCDLYWLTAVQIGMVALCSNICAWGRGVDVFFWEPGILWAMIICVLFATVFAFLVQTGMQRFTSPTKTALIFCLEPVFGAIYANLFGGETLGEWGGIGAACIVLAMIMAELPGKKTG
ncbi:MAG: DMT family transporter [Desulfoplanes sp.]|nr:DMT family transporter [Desulfoplanes sp.]